MKDGGEIEGALIDGDEVHVKGHRNADTGAVRPGWTFFGYVGDADLAMRLGIE